MTKLDDNLSEIFEVETLKSAEIDTIDIPSGEIVEIKNTEVATLPPGDALDMEVDYDEIRTNTKDLLLKGKIALDCALDVVQQSDQPRAFEVFSTLLGQMSAINQQLFDLHHKKKNIKSMRSSPEGSTGPGGTVQGNVNNTAIFVGSTTDLNRMITKLIKEE